MKRLRLPFVPLALAVGAARTAPQVSTGFLGFGWGATKSVIEERLGAPLRTHDVPGGQLLFYKRPFLEKEALAFMWVDRKDGLLKGMYIVSISESVCEAEYTRLKTTIGQRFAAVAPRDAKRNDTGEAFCQALKQKKASWITVWTMPDSSKVGLQMNITPTSLFVHVESAAFESHRRDADRVALDSLF